MKLRNQKTFLLFTILFFLAPVLVYAQMGNTGMRFSQYGGTMSTLENPAFGAAGKLKWEVQLFNLNEMLENNNLALDWRAILNDSQFTLLDASGSQTQQLPVSDFSLRNVLELCGPSVMYSYKQKYSIGINTRSRFFFQLNDANTELANTILSNDNFNISDYGIVSEDYINLNINILTDLGLTGSVKVLNGKKHKLYVGGSLRFYKGIAALDFTGRDVYIDPDKTINADSVVEFSADFKLNTSMPEDIDFLTSGQNISANTLFQNVFNNAAGNGVGGDIGVLYEGTILSRKIRASVSVTDIGSISYNKGRQRSANFLANNVSIPIDSFDNIPSEYDSIRSWAAAYGVQVDTGANSFVQSLPTRLNLYGELQLNDKFSVGLASGINLNSANTLASSYSSYTALIPRFQSKMLECWVPISYNYFSDNLKAGLGFRLAYFYMGTDDVLSLAQSRAKSANFYLGFRVAGAYSKRKLKKLEKGSAD